MGQTTSTANASSRFKWLKVAIASAVALLFVCSLLIAVFIGGELTPEVEVSATKGLMRLSGEGYASSYISGDKFSFDKSKNNVLLVAKDMSLDGKVVKVDKLPDQEYGFAVNGGDEIIFDPDELIMTADVHTVELVSKQYPDIRIDLPVRVYASLDESKLASSVTVEAEKGDLYTASGELLTEEQKTTLPNAEKPYNSAAGTSPSGTDLSGGACLRNFSSGMKLDLSFASSVSGKYTLTIKTCKRPKATEFDSGVTMYVNGVETETGVTVPADGNSGYFSPYEFTIEIYVSRGLNTVTFESIGSNCNLDAIVITSPDGSAVFGDKTAVGELVNVVESDEETQTPEETPEEPSKEEEDTPETGTDGQ